MLTPWKTWPEIYASRRVALLQWTVVLPPTILILANSSNFTYLPVAHKLWKRLILPVPEMECVTQAHCQST